MVSLSYISSIQWPPVASGYHIGQCGFRSFHHCKKSYWTLTVKRLALSGFPRERTFWPKRYAKEVRRALLIDSGIRMMASAGHRVGRGSSPLADPRVWYNHTWHLFCLYFSKWCWGKHSNCVCHLHFLTCVASVFYCSWILSNTWDGR